MKINPEQEPLPAQDVKDSDGKRDGNNIFDVADFLKGLITSKPMLTGLIQQYGLNNKEPWFTRHRHTVKKGKDLGFDEISFGNQSIWVYVLFILDLLMKVFLMAVYIIAIGSLLLLALRAVELPEYVMNNLLQSDSTQEVNVRIVE